MNIIIGTNNLKSGGTHLKVEQMITHKQYDEPQFAYDIGLIRVQGQIEFNDKVQPIKFSRNEVPGNVTLRAFGWGRLTVSIINRSTQFYRRVERKTIDVYYFHFIIITSGGGYFQTNCKRLN